MLEKAFEVRTEEKVKQRGGGREETGASVVVDFLMVHREQMTRRSRYHSLLQGSSGKVQSRFMFVYVCSRGADGNRTMNFRLERSPVI